MYGYGTNPLDNMQRQLEQMRVPMAQPTSNIIWVQGEAGAKGYQMPNKSNMLVMDSENEGTMYILSSDEVGMRKMRVFHFEEVEPKPAEHVDMTQYATKDDVRAIILEMFGEGGKGNDKAVQGTPVTGTIV